MINYEIINGLIFIGLGIFFFGMIYFWNERDMYKRRLEYFKKELKYWEKKDDEKRFEKMLVKKYGLKEVE